MMATRAQERTALALASLVFAVAAPLAYLAERYFERLRSGRVSPQLILSEVHAGFYWRATLAAWFGGFIAALVWRMLRDSGHGARPRPAWMIPAIVAIAPLAILWALRFP
jgi:hypothetical protein